MSMSWWAVIFTSCEVNHQDKDKVLKIVELEV